MRHEGRDKERIELSLDTKQVVSIVLGSAALLGIVFYLGVTVGKDLGAAPGAPVDPLAALDEKAERGDDPLTFADELTKAEGRAPVAAREPPRNEKPVAAEEASAAAVPPAPAEPAPPAGDPPAGEAGAAPAAEVVAAEAQEAPAPKAPVRDLSAALLQAQATKAEDAAPKAPSTKPDEPAKAPAPAKAAFTVQVASLPNRAEADGLAGRLRKQGLSPWVAEAEIPGKGTFYRVRLGRFPNREDAVRYLDDLKRETRMDGFVASVD